MYITIKHIILTVFISCIAGIQSIAQSKDLTTGKSSESYLQHAPVKNIGPTIFGGRVVDLAVNPENTDEFFVAYASGGLWYTANNGTTFEPRFDDQAVITIGDLDVHWPSKTIYLGSGEVNSSRSSYAGDGVYKSTDLGETWSYLGLPESHHIGRVIINTDNPEVVNVAVLGHLYSANPERGMYRTADGGQTWSRTLFVNDNTGAVDLAVHPDNPNTLYTAMWQRSRRAWDFTEAGAGSGIYKSEDGGVSWSSISEATSGFPQGDGIGRIGLAVHTDTYATVVYALLDNYDRRPEQPSKKSDILTKNDFANMDKATFDKLDDNKLQTYLDENGLDSYTASVVKGMVADGKINPVALKEYVEDANRLLFDTPVIGAEVYVTNDDGSSWMKTHEGYLDGLYNSYGYYFGQIEVNPHDVSQLYIMGVPILRSDDAGHTWKNINGDNVHVDHHALWINPNKPSHIINGNDGGINISYDSGENWTRPPSPAVGQFYTINVDHQEHYQVYGGTQDNGVWTGRSSYKEGVRWQMSGSYPYETIMGGDGMQVQIDTRDNTTVYTGYQFGNYFRINEDGGRTYITPKHKLGDRPYRWNWQSPILLSPHSQDIVYFGANKLLRSMDKGDTFVEISDDLTHGGKVGDVAYGTLTCISESSLQFGLLYVGSDDGRVHLSKDGGHTWTDISAALPDGLWVSRVWASAHSKDRVYVAVNGYRNDDFTPYVYTSDDYGTTWQSISGDLPSGPVNVVKEDKKAEDVLYVGTDHGAFISVDRGLTFMKVGNLPNVPVHDLIVHEPSKDLLIATHGRSIYKVNLNTFTKGVAGQEPIVVNASAEIIHNSTWGKKRRAYDKADTPVLPMEIFSKQAGTGTLVVSMAGKNICSKTIEVPLGLSTAAYDLSIDAEHAKTVEKILKKQSDNKHELQKAEDGKYYLPPGDYELELSLKGQAAVHKLKVKA